MNSRSRTNSITRQLIAELRVLWYSRVAALLVVAVALGALIAVSGSMSNARAADAQFTRQVAIFEENGVRLEDALAAPLTISREGQAETIDNPLKYDYLEVGKAISALDGVVPLAGTVLDLSTFIIVPLAFVILGAHSATFDLRARTMKLRASRDPWRAVGGAKLLSIAAMAALATAAALASAAVLSVPTALWADQFAAAAGYPVAPPPPPSPLVAKLLMSWGVAVFFGLIGYAAGAVTRSPLWPAVAGAAVLFLLPFVGPWDPRNLIASIAEQVYDFRGQFKVRPALPVEPAVAAALLAAWVAVAGAVAMAFPTRSARAR